MIRYYCDACGNEIENYNEENDSLFLPRQIESYAKDKNGVKLLAVNRIKIKETMVCESCKIRLAGYFMTIKED